jgi:peroxiredoxin
VSITDSSIADQVAEFQQGAATQLPADVAAAFTAEQRELAAAGLPAGITAPGQPMPEGKLLDVNGRATTLAEARGGRPAVVVFYRGGWCPYCSITLRTYQARLVPELTARGVALIAVSPQKPDGSLTTQQAKELTYTVLSDPGNQIASQLGILTGPTGAVAAAQAALGLDLTQVNADGTAGLPMPAVVIVDAAGNIRWIDVHPDYTTRSEPGDILAALTAAVG